MVGALTIEHNVSSVAMPNTLMVSVHRGMGFIYSKTEMGGEGLMGKLFS